MLYDVISFIEVRPHLQAGAYSAAMLHTSLLGTLVWPHMSTSLSASKLAKADAHSCVPGNNAHYSGYWQLSWSALPDVLSAVVQEARRKGGRVLLHCSQGVSRSAALAIAHLMWTSGLPFEKALEAVKAKRGIVNPNINFTCQVRLCAQQLAAPAMPRAMPAC